MTRPLKRHNDASHPLYAFSALADFGLRADDAGISEGIEAALAHQSPEGAFQTWIRVPRSYGGTDGAAWTWMACDAPTLLYTLLAMGLGEDPRVQRAVEHLVGLVDDDGWRCVVAPELADSPATRTGAEMLLWHWENRNERKIYLFGIGTTLRRLKYPFVWYDVLHVVDVLSRFPFVHGDSRFREMIETITDQADRNGRYTAGSMHRIWKGWSFANKKHPSPWLTCLVLRVQQRMRVRLAHA